MRPILYDNRRARLAIAAALMITPKTLSLTA